MSDFDRILSSKPVNRQSAVVAEGKGEAWEPKKTIGQLHSDCPIPTQPFRGQHNNPDSQDWSGLQIGRLTVVGYYGGNGSKQPGRWVVRCVCGGYEVRSTKYLNRCRKDADKAAHARCQKCDYWRRLSAREKRQKGGS